MKQLQFSDKRKFFYDCEFMEEPGFLQLISIAVVADDGREFYACNKDANLDMANDWVTDNVLPLLPKKGADYWMTEEAIKEGLLNFMAPSKENPLELWGYYSDYDHVLLCWLFGRMVDLPAGMPKYTLDLKQVTYHMGNIELPENTGVEHDALEDARWIRDAFDHLMKLEKFDL